MRTSLTILALGVLLCGAPAAADEPLAASKALDAKLAGMERWKDRWDAYQEAKDAREEEREALSDARDAWRQREAWKRRETEGEAALSDSERLRAEMWDARSPEGRARADVWDEFVAVQTRIAASLRRSNLSVAGWLMAFFAASLLWGGFAVTVTIAIRSERQKRNARAA